MLLGLPDYTKGNRDKSKITKYLIFPICFFSKGDILQFFLKKFDKFEISELVSSDNTVSCVLMHYKYDEF